MMSNRRPALILAALVAPFGVHAQSLDPKPLPPFSETGGSAPARELFGRRTAPSSLAARAIGSYSRGCLAGARAMPVEGKTWQVMRLDRNRYWGHPKLIAFLEKLSAKVPEAVGWPGVLVGDLSQPRGGPMMTAHLSHQIGLDADLWFSPMPDRKMTRSDREEMVATSLLREDKLDIDPKVYNSAHLKLVKLVAEEPEVDRVFVNAGIKKAFCRDAGNDRAWLAKVRPILGHNYHFHIRLACPAGECRDQAAVPPGDGCGDLGRWFQPEFLNPGPGGPLPTLTLAQLPEECRRVLVSP